MKHKHVFDPLDEKVDLKGLLDAIYFAEEDYRTANLNQAKLMYTAARYRVQMLRRRKRAEAQLNLIRSKVSYGYRKKHRGGKAPTEGAVRDKLNLHSDVIAAQKALDKIEVDEELAKQLYEVFKQRQIAINNVIKANGNNIAANLWELEKNSKHQKLKDAAKVIRGKYRTKEEESDE